jgi:hypothetical protein
VAAKPTLAILTLLAIVKCKVLAYAVEIASVKMTFVKTLNVKVN